MKHPGKTLLVLALVLMCASCYRTNDSTSEEEVSTDSDTTHPVMPDTSSADSAGTDTLDSDDTSSVLLQDSCDTLLAIWKESSDWASPCGACLIQTEESCPQLLENEECWGVAGCLQRHCLCSADQLGSGVGDCSDRTYPDNLCTCADTCLPHGQSPCRDIWDRFGNCVIVKCGAVCNSL